MNFYNNDLFSIVEKDMLENINGGKEWYEWVGDIGSVVGGAAVAYAAATGVGLGVVVVYVAVEYLYQVN